ncbi:hypothetical protein HYU07_05845 [Candidatus Woesearchaeota archaeon]|nr:hypothetical protein [Candidatus Woesearchaeota archaeon]
MVGGGTSEIVDLVTTSRELEDIMINEFPGKITEEQHKVDIRNQLYHFYSLTKRTLLDFLKPYKGKYEYCVEYGGHLIEISLVRVRKHFCN